MPLDAMTIAKAIRSEMPQAWNDVNGASKPFPGDPNHPSDDQLVLFLAIARGLLKQLDAQHDAIKTIDLRQQPGGTTTSFDVTSSAFNVTTA